MPYDPQEPRTRVRVTTYTHGRGWQTFTRYIKTDNNKRALQHAMRFAYRMQPNAISYEAEIVQ